MPLLHDPHSQTESQSTNRDPLEPSTPRFALQAVSKVKRNFLSLGKTAFVELPADPAE